MLLNNKTVIITGCNRGIGKSILETFIKNGANIIACVRKENINFTNYLLELEKTYKISIKVVYFDFEDFSEIKKAINEISSFKVQINVLVNNTGIASGSSFQMTSINELEKVMKINFTSQMLFTQGISRIMSKNGEGSIINISSVAGIIGDIGNISYGSSKAALNFATKTIASELGRYNIRVNAIAPSITETDMFFQMSESAREKLIQSSSLKRVGKPEEIANTALFLASELSSLITGQILRVDGGII
jgi:3-oxoacyl-[acyl-carrier protein] reductase